MSARFGKRLVEIFFEVCTENREDLSCSFGRYGAFKHNNQNHSLLMGILDAENVLIPGKHNLWAVNYDSDYAKEAQADVATTAAKVLHPSKHRQIVETAKQLSGYLVAGGFATIVDVTLFSLVTQIQNAVFTAVAINSLLANLGLLQVLVNDLHWSTTIARLTSAGCVALLSFVEHRLCSFGQAQSARSFVR